MNNARRVNPATPLRRLSTRAIHAVVGVPVAFLVFAVPALVGVFLGVLLYGDGLLWAQRIVAIVLISATWAIYVSAWVFVLRRAQINGWQLCAIFTPAIVLLVMSAIFVFLWFDPLPYLLSAASYVSIWTIGSLFLLSHGQTVGEALSGILAVRQSGEPVNWGQLFVREVVKSLLHVFLIGFIIDGIMMLSDKTERQSVADRIAGTVVVRSGQ